MANLHGRHPRCVSVENAISSRRVVRAGAVHSIISGNAHNEPMMSAFHPIATEQRTQFYVGFVPKAEIAARRSIMSSAAADLALPDRRNVTAIPYRLPSPHSTRPSRLGATRR